MNDKNRQRHLAYEALVILGQLALLTYITRLWPTLLLIILGIFIATLRLLFLSSKKVEPVKPLPALPPPARLPSEVDIFTEIPRKHISFQKLSSLKYIHWNQWKYPSYCKRRKKTIIGICSLLQCLRECGRVNFWDWPGIVWISRMESLRSNSSFNAQMAIIFWKRQRTEKAERSYRHQWSWRHWSENCKNKMQKKKQAGSAWSNPYNLVFTDALGKNLVRRTVVKHFKKIIQRTDISDTARFHDLRHSFAVTSLYAGDDIKTVQANLGHATAQFTLDVYGHVTQKMRKDSANRMQQFYDQIKASQNAP